MKLRSLPVTKKQWQSKYLSAKRSAPVQAKRGSITRMQQASSLRAIRSGKVYSFKGK